LADFRNAVVIMTSNLGAESFGRHAVGFRESHEAFMAAAEHFTREVRDFLRPELFNRIDRIVSFLPLDEDTLLALARRELDLLRQREGIRYRDVCLDYADEAVHELVGLGCDPRYGARPLKRAVDRHVLAPLAAAMNDYAADTPLTAFVGGKGGEIRVAVKSRPPAESAPTKPGPGDVSPNDLANQVLRFRREASALWHSEPLTAVQNELYRLEREQQRANRRRRDRAVSPRRLIDVANLKRLREGCAAVLARAKAIEDEFLLACYTGGTYDAAAILDGLAAGGAEFHSSVIELYRREHDDTDAITVVVYGSDLAWNFMLAETYLNLARKRQCAVQAYEIGLSGKDSPSDSRTFPLKAAVSDEPRSRKKADQPVLVASLIPEPEGFLGNPREGLIGIALRFQGLVARPIFEPEAGLHEFLVGKRRERVLVDCSTALIQEYEPPPKIERKEGISLQPVRRSYQLARRTIDDRLTGSSTRWSGEDFGPAVMRLAEDRFLSHLRSWLAR
jgi:hypothetical protein